jgi:DNA-binding NarL/FixJ family response regulator
MKIRVCIFEDSKNFRDGLADLIRLSPQFEFLGAFPDCSEMVEKISTLRPDVILMDIRMPGMTGIEAVQIIKSKFPTTKVIMQTVYEDDERVTAAIIAGASGYLLKNSPPQKFVEAVEDAFHGGAPMTGSIAAKVLALFQTKFETAKTDNDTGLSPREKEVLQKLVQGKSYKMIAADLGISYVTVRFHMKNIYEKLHVSSMTEAVAKAVQERIV